MSKPTPYRAGLGDVNMNGLGIVDMNVGVHHSNRNNFDNTDDISVWFGATDSHRLKWLAVRTTYDRRSATRCKGVVAGESIHRRQATSTSSTDPDFIGRIG